MRKDYERDWKPIFVPITMTGVVISGVAFGIVQAAQYKPIQAKVRNPESFSHEGITIEFNQPISRAQINPRISQSVEYTIEGNTLTVNPQDKKFLGGRQPLDLQVQYTGLWGPESATYVLDANIGLFWSALEDHKTLVARKEHVSSLPIYEESNLGIALKGINPKQPAIASFISPEESLCRCAKAEGFFKISLDLDVDLDKNSYGFELALPHGISIAVGELYGRIIALKSSSNGVSKIDQMLELMTGKEVQLTKKVRDEILAQDGNQLSGELRLEVEFNRDLINVKISTKASDNVKTKFLVDHAFKVNGIGELLSFPVDESGMRRLFEVRSYGVEMLIKSASVFGRDAPTCIK